MVNLEEAIKRYKKHSECIQQTLITKEEAMNVYEWLKELKGLKENKDVKDVFNNCVTCKYRELDSNDYPCDRCMHRYINQYVYDDQREVNADDNIQS